MNMPKDTRGYNVARVIGLTGDEDLVDVRVSSDPVTTEILELLSPCVTAANELKVKVTGDIIIGEIQVDNVQLIDDEGHELDFTASGAIQNYVNDGWDVAQGSTADTVTAPTTIGNLKALNAKDFATEATLTAAAASLDTIKAIDFATETTLATLATEAKLEAARALLETISGLNFAEETTQAAIETAIGATTDADTELTVIGRLKKILATLEGGITVTESAPLTSIAATVADGDDVALGSTSDTDSDMTVIGRLQKLIVDLSALSATKTLADLETAIEGVTDSIVSMQYGGLPVSEMRTDVVSTSSTPAEAKGGATAWSGQRIVHILNQGSVNIEVLTDDEATYGQIVFPGDVYQDVVDGVIYVMSASAGSARVTEKRYVS